MKLKTKDITLCALFAALIAVGAFLQIKIPLPLYEMHFTLQWFFVICAALLLGKKRGTFSVIIYMIIGLSGIPVFAAGGGPSYVLRPGFGFILGFAAAAFVIGLLSEKQKGDRLLWSLLAAVVGMVVYYTVGAVYFYLIKRLYVGEAVLWRVIIVQYCLITVLPDLLLCVFAALLCRKIKPQLSKMMNEQR